MDLAKSIQQSDWDILKAFEDKKAKTDLGKRNKGNLTFKLIQKKQKTPTTFTQTVKPQITFNNANSQ